MLSRESVKFRKKLLGENDVEVLLQKLDQLMQEESQMVTMLMLEVVHDLAKILKVVMESELHSFFSNYIELNTSAKMKRCHRTKFVNSFVCLFQSQKSACLTMLTSFVE